ncbi:MAG: class I SAM-dependent methyltransferase [Desulfobacterales bacterium]|nr:class I SAM-dependent methyltransferase [Desulfobacterales bacterium]
MGTKRQKIANFLRKVHLLTLADKVMFLLNVYKNRKSNRRFLVENPSFRPIPYLLSYDAYHDTNWRYYHNIGLKYSELISDMVIKLIQENNIKILEWGCGPARIIRHLKKIEGFEKVALFGSDYNRKSIQWCHNNINNIRFYTNSMTPPLLYESEVFDCVYAISVFTHLSEKMHFAWIKELFRTLKPNGILIFSTHGDNYANRLLSPEEKAKYDSGSLVLKTHSIKEGQKFFGAFHPPSYIKNKLLKDFSIVKNIPDPSEKYKLDQEVWVVKKR